MSCHVSSSCLKQVVDGAAEEKQEEKSEESAFECPKPVFSTQRELHKPYKLHKNISKL